MHKPPSGPMGVPLPKPVPAKVDCKYIRIVIKSQGNPKKDEAPKENLIQLPRKWLEDTQSIPHFSNVIENVGEQEGVEITMNCNFLAFMWVVDVIKISTGFRDDLATDEHDYSPLQKNERESLI